MPRSAGGAVNVGSAPRGETHSKSKTFQIRLQARYPPGLKARLRPRRKAIALLREIKIVDITSCLLLGAAAFSGALVSGLVGFAFSAVAGAILLQVFPPLEAVPVMMACSIGVQAANLWTLRKDIQWKRSLVLIIGGLLGIPIAVYILQSADTRSIRAGFGAFLAIYAAYSLCRPTLAYLRQMENQGQNALVGFCGGLIGGLTAMPGALPAIWCDIHGVPKIQQRSFVQPFIAVMQAFALAVMLMRSSLSSKILVDLAISLPPLAVGTIMGIVMFNRVNEVAFRRIVLFILFFSGLSLVI
jgi:uncharacterized membrane protein YfcA